MVTVTNLLHLRNSELLTLSLAEASLFRHAVGVGSKLAGSRSPTPGESPVPAAPLSSPLLSSSSFPFPPLYLWSDWAATLWHTEATEEQEHQKKVNQWRLPALLH